MTDQRCTECGGPLALSRGSLICTRRLCGAFGQEQEHDPDPLEDEPFQPLQGEAAQRIRQQLDAIFAHLNPTPRGLDSNAS